MSFGIYTSIKYVSLTSNETSIKYFWKMYLKMIKMIKLACYRLAYKPILYYYVVLGDKTPKTRHSCHITCSVWAEVWWHILMRRVLVAEKCREKEQSVKIFFCFSWFWSQHWSENLPLTSNPVNIRIYVLEKISTSMVNKGLVETLPSSFPSFRLNNTK